MFTESDLKEYRKCRLILNQAKVEIDISAIGPLATAVQWFDRLEKIIVGSIAMKNAEVKKEPIKKNKKVPNANKSQS